MSITLPSNWQVESLGKCCTIVSGATPRRDVPEYWDNHIPWVTPKDISNLNDPILEDTPEYISEAGYKNCSAKLLPKRSVLFSSRAPIGLVALTGREMCTNQGFKSLIPGKKVHSEYLYHCMKWMAPKIAELGNGATFKEVSKEVISRVEIPLPPLAEQKRIAAILDKADAIRRKRQAAIKLADDFLRATFLDMFGDPVTNPKGWDRVKIGEVTKDWRGGASLAPSDFTDAGFPILHKGAIHTNGNIVIDTGKKTFTTIEYANAHRKSVIYKDYLAVTLRDLVPTGPSIGLIADLSQNQLVEYMLAQGAYGFKINISAIKPSYLVALSNNRGFRSELKKYWVGSTQIHIRTPVFQEISIPLPKLSQQEQYEIVTKKTNMWLTKQKNFNEFTGVLFKSLTQRAFYGKL